MSDKIQVLVVDDSSVVRKIITAILESDPMINVVGTANNGKTAILKNKELNPDIIIMDIEMPVLDGLSALKSIIETSPKPVIMMSVLTQHGVEAAFKALDYGAVDFISKPSSLISLSTDEISEQLRSKVKSVYRSKINIPNVSDATKITEPEEKKRADEKKSSSKIVGIGSSTGGPSALLNIFKNFPENFPSSVLVVQHMPVEFTKTFSERLNSESNLKVKEAADMDRILPGCGYIAPGDSHIAIEKKNNEKFVRVFNGEKVLGHKPSIDVLFHSLAEKISKNTIAVIMTGMGRDGAEGILEIKNSGGYTIAQNEETSVVYGMNRVAIKKGGIKEILPLHEIAKKIVEYI